MSAVPSLRRAGAVVQAAIGGLLVLALVLAIVSLSRRADLAAWAANRPGALDEVLRGDAIGPRVGWAMITVGLLHAVAFGVFFHRGHRALERLTGNESAARVGAISFFVPFANLALPLLAAKGILDGARVKASGVLFGWWLPFVGAVLLRSWSVRTFDAAVADGDIDGARAALLLDAFGCVGIAASMAAAVVLVGRMTEAVTARVVRPAP